MKNTRNINFILIIILNIILDQVSKIYIRKTIDPTETISVLGSYFQILNVENSGAFLGLGSDLSEPLRILLLLALPVIVLAGVIYYVVKDKNLDKTSVIAFAMIIGGGIANVFDRFAYGSVTDFLFINLGGVFKTGIFNVADMSVTGGMILLLISNFKSNKVSK